jgi:hypothetical protein
MRGLKFSNWSERAILGAVPLRTVIAAVALSACAIPSPCTTDLDCSNYDYGQCNRLGYCTLGNSKCASGAAYVPSSPPEIAEHCVPADIDHLQECSQSEGAATSTVGCTLPVPVGLHDALVVTCSWQGTHALDGGSAGAAKLTLLSSVFDSVHNRGLAVLAGFDQASGSATVSCAFDAPETEATVIAHEYTTLATGGGAGIANSAIGDTACPAVITGDLDQLMFVSTLDISDPLPASITFGGGFASHENGPVNRARDADSPGDGGTVQPTLSFTPANLDWLCAEARFSRYIQ